ncbi:hypothetical protein X737_12745 [Mesorhizobium sp. L48C026A00]|nr:hypothetical protein X737_12745 [Mesorhizobium sp. L48C026A00]
MRPRSFMPAISATSGEIGSFAVARLFPAEQG